MKKRAYLNNAVRAILPVAVSLLATLRAFSWGAEGHKDIAAFAQTMLSNSVLAHVQALLGTNDMASVATWADEARELMQFEHHKSRFPGPLQGNPEAEKFIRKHPDNDQWHFDNLPLGTTNYLYNGAFATNDDVVHVLTNCIAVLEGHSRFVTRTQALRYIIHLVGDIHQPLHVGCGFYTNEAGKPVLLTDPTLIRNHHANDLGGNSLLFMTGTSTNKLHAFWDDDMVKKVNPGGSRQQMIPTLTAAVATNNCQSPGSDFHQWPARWAEESVVEARGIYEGVTLDSFIRTSPSIEIAVTLEPNYADKQLPRATRQLARAGFHLAELLNQIKWK